MNVFEFIELTKKEPDKWKGSCEIIIKRNGEIELARPSHTEKLIEIYCNNMGITREEFTQTFPTFLHIISFICEKFKLICVWYDFLIGPEKFNRFQNRTLKLLKDEKIINVTRMNVATEYSWYLNAMKTNIRDDMKEGL